VTGEVEIGSHSSIWFNTVVRGDAAPIIIGAETNIQDGARCTRSTKRAASTSATA